MTSGRFFVLLVSVAIAGSGCGGGSGTTLTAQPAAQTFQLSAGASSQKEALQALNFYTPSLTIDAGDTVTWTFPTGEPHTVTFLGPRTAPPPPNDPTVPKPAGGATYDGSTYTSSGYVLLGKTYSLTFTKPGTYQYYCLLHAASGMLGTIVVHNAGVPYPASQSAVTAAATTSSSADIAQDLTAVGQFPYAASGTHVAAGLSPGLNVAPLPNGLTVLRFLNGTSLEDTSTTVVVGGTVTWTNLSDNEPHTVTFGPANQPFPTLNPFSPPSGGTIYDGSQLVNSGVLHAGQSFSVSFPKAGSYTYHCIFHDDTENMTGTVVVQ